ncbi:GPP34 family phosphoprotein [Streptomyces sp. NRRL F-6676]|uniref:GPP34 family phosphoprotein n=1 Tax=Streptomyces sp. NRRL F-6676 TaxID=1463878 RepID=UPI000561B020|nr:GPP34 family phosphoprotein [Streptomyces sp. NRRL F-6676]
MIDDLACLMYLLAHDEGAEGPYDRSRTALLVRAAALTDLALRGRLREDGGTVTVHGTGSTGSPVLDAVLRDAAGHGWKHLVRRHRRRTLAEVEDRLAAAGVLSLTAPRARVGARRSTVTDHPAAVAVGAPAAPPGGPRSPRRSRIDACTERLAALAPGLEQAVRALPTTMIAARGGMGGG